MSTCKLLENEKKRFQPVLFVNLALYFTGAVCLYSTGHWIGGTFLLGAWVRVALITGI